MTCLVDEHGGGETSQAAMIEVCSTPVIITRWHGFLGINRKVVQQASFGCSRCLDDVLEVAGLVAIDPLLGVAVTCFGYQDCGVDDDTTEILEGFLEASDVRPEVGRQVLGEILC